MRFLSNVQRFLLLITQELFLSKFQGKIHHLRQGLTGPNTQLFRNPSCLLCTFAQAPQSFFDACLKFHCSQYSDLVTQVEHHFNSPSVYLLALWELFLTSVAPVFDAVCGFTKVQGQVHPSFLQLVHISDLRQIGLVGWALTWTRAIKEEMSYPLFCLTKISLLKVRLVGWLLHAQFLYCLLFSILPVSSIQLSAQLIMSIFLLNSSSKNLQRTLFGYSLPA